MPKNDGFIYRCPKKCILGKKCFIIKTEKPINHQLVVLFKCDALKADVRLTIGDPRPP